MAPSRQIGWGREEILLSDILKQITRLGQVISASAGGGGSVTSVSVVTANGFAGTVATASTTPAITISTNVTGLLKGDGTAVSAAVAGTDYLAPGGSGAALTGVYLLASGGTLTGANTITGTTANIVKYVFNALVATQTNGAGIWLANTTAATVGVQQRSPSVVLEGQGWKTTATASSQSVKFLIDVLPVQGTTSPTGTFGIYPSVNGAAYSATPNFSITTTGVTRVASAGDSVEGFYYGTPASRRISLFVNDTSAVTYMQGMTGASTINWFIGQTSASTVYLSTEISPTGWTIRNNVGDGNVINVLNLNTSSISNQLSPLSSSVERIIINCGIHFNPASASLAAPISVFKYTGSWVDGFSGTAAYTVFDLNHTLNTTTGTRPTYGLRYRPTVTATGGIQYFVVDETVGARSGFGITAPTAKLHVGAGTTTLAPLKLTSGTNLTTAEAGAFEYNGADLFFTKSGTTRGNVLVATAVTTEVVVSDTTLTITYQGTTYKVLARA